MIATLSGSWTPLISNSAGSVTILGATISYGTWFWWIGGITLASLAVAAGTTRFDSQLGIAVRRWCGPVLGLSPDASPD